jgi:serine/threonine protein kinase/tetratricopeptide (TPR) repeat protein
MIGRTPDPSCVKCGHSVPQDAGFCPNCGTQVHDSSFYSSDPPTPETMLPAPTANAGGDTAKTVASGIGQAFTVGPSFIATSLDNPSPRPPIPAGDGPFQAGQQINPRYTILKLLGIGGMGAVYQAFDHELGVAVAIKVIRPAAQSDATAAKDLEQRFKRELVLARQVTHKYVVRIHDLGEIAGIKYLTMPYVEGETLAQVMRRVGPLPLASVIRVAQQVAQGLAAAHEKGVIHRDLKPENIMVESAADQPVPLGGDALIMDFGIARSVEAGTTQTAAGSVIGTLEYMAPEQAQGKKVDQRADIYAFGLIVYDMLLGRQRLKTGEGPMAELMQRIAAAPPALRTVNPQIPGPVNDIVMRCLHPKPEDRYPATQDLVNALDHLTPDGHVRSDVHEVIVTKRRPLWQVAAAALAIVVAAGSAGWYVSNRTSNNDIPTRSELGLDPISVLIGDFDNKTGDPVFDGVVEQALSFGIEGASFVSAYPRREALRAAAAIKAGAKLDEPTARLVALRENLGLVLIGAIEPKGSGYHITVKGVGPGNDAAVKFTLEDDAASKAAVLATVGSLAGQVRGALGDTVAPAPADTFTAASLEAAREYARAQELLAGGQAEAAIPVYLAAAKLDPDFGRAWSGAATAARNMNRPDEARKYYEEALAKMDRMTDREKLRTRGQYYLFTGNSAKAIEENEALITRYPSDGVGLGNLGFAYFQTRQFDQAAAIVARAVQLQPTNVPRLNNAALYALYAGKFEDAMAGGKKASDLQKTYGPAWLTQALSAAALAKYDEASASYTTLGALAGFKAVSAQGLADLAMLRGRLSAAAAALEPMLADSIAANQQARVHTTLAAVRLAQGRSADAIALAERALKLSGDGVTRFEAGRILLAAGRTARARELAAALDKSLSPETQAQALALTGEIHLVAGDARAAIDSFQRSLKLANAWYTRYLLGRAYLAAGAFPEATSEFDACLTRQGEAAAIYLDDVPTWRMIAPVYYYQGVARAALRSTAGAAEAFRTFVAFKDGGDEQGGLVADARKRLAQ